MEGRGVEGKGMRERNEGGAGEGREQEAGGRWEGGREDPSPLALAAPAPPPPWTWGRGGWRTLSEIRRVPSSQLLLCPLGSGGVSSPHSTTERIKTVQK